MTPISTTFGPSMTDVRNRSRRFSLALNSLRRSMLALMERKDNPYFAHPAFWAPFVVVGD
jgi:CHAT domain-containing protein